MLREQVMRLLDHAQERARDARQLLGASIQTTRHGAPSTKRHGPTAGGIRQPACRFSPHKDHYQIAAFALTRERIQRIAFRVVSQIGIRYRKSSLSESLQGLPDSAPRGGDRFPWLRLKLQANGSVEDLLQKLDDRRFNLIIIGQASPSEGALDLGDMCRIHVIPADPINDVELARTQIPRPSCARTAMSGFAGLASKLPQSNVTSLSACASVFEARADVALGC